ncbi:MAG: caspase family protein [Sphingomonadales bacterium]|nr:caspase family protein [Sphingomonadales bacterium]
MLARLLFIVAIFSLQSPAFSQQAGRRVALVIANGNYANTNRLDNPLNDGRLIAESLRKTGFAVVDMRSDQGLLTFQQSLRDFRAKADGADVALIYYAGHGIEGQGKNWLIPTDAKLATALSCKRLAAQKCALRS